MFQRQRSEGRRGPRGSTAGQRGQTATEYMLVISVLVIGVTAASYSFNPQFKAALNDLLGANQQTSEAKLNIPAQINRGFVNQNPQ